MVPCCGALECHMHILLRNDLFPICGSLLFPYWSLSDYALYDLNKYEDISIRVIWAIIRSYCSDGGIKAGSDGKHLHHLKETSGGLGLGTDRGKPELGNKKTMSIP